MYKIRRRCASVNISLTSVLFACVLRYLAVDLLASCSQEECSSDTLLSGYLSITVDLEEKLTDSFVAVVYAWSPDSLDIDDSLNCRLQRTIL